MSNGEQVDFNSSIIVLATIVAEFLGLQALLDGLVVRDGFGRLSFFSGSVITAKVRQSLETRLHHALQGYAAPYGVVQDNRSSAYLTLRHANRLIVNVHIDDQQYPISLIDRRFSGRDWLSFESKPTASSPPVMVFCSLKGGVGRSTALLILAISLSRRGKNVLAFDLDLEAPGMAALGFSNDPPVYGVIDYLVESAIHRVPDDHLTLFVGQSDLTDDNAGQGRIDIVPAVGQDTAIHPSSMMAKLARAIVERPSDMGHPLSFAEQIEEMVDRFSQRSHYDVVLVDARAGLSEITAGPLLALGAEIALFGTDQPHTFEGFRYLMSHLAMLPVKGNDDWRQRLHFVHAKARTSQDSRAEFQDKLYDVLADTFYEEDDGPDVFNFNLDDESAPHNPWRIFFNSEYIDADPIKNRSLLEEDVLKAAFGSFVSRAIATLGIENDAFDPSTILG